MTLPLGGDSSLAPVTIPTLTEPVSDASCGGPRALCGWSPPPLQADTRAKRIVDRLMPRTGIAVITYFAAIAGLMALAALLPKRGELVMDGLAALAAASWCGLNFWRCRHAHCVVTASGWSVLAAFTFLEAVIGRSLIAGDEQLVFLFVLAAGLAFEGAWYLVRGTNAVAARPPVQLSTVSSSKPL